MADRREIGRVEFEEHEESKNVVLYNDGFIDSDCSPLLRALFGAMVEHHQMTYKGPQDGYYGYKPLYDFSHWVNGRVTFDLPEEEPNKVY